MARLSDPTVRSPAVRLAAGTRVGPYEVVSLLGAGGMAEVYRARDSRLGRDVAIKVVSEALGADGASLDRFEREAKLAGSLSHPNIVALHDVGVHEGKSYFVTELLQGETLRERLAKGPIQLSLALEWAAQMARGLSAAHEHGIVHRDLKPENVFVTRDEHVKLLDFGIAKAIAVAHEVGSHNLMAETVSPSGGNTGTGMVLGTPGYMSPEQVRGEPVDARTDFFSLGAVLYEMLCGRRAFPSGPAVESGYAILHNEPEAMPPAIPALVAQVVHRCMEKDRGRRFQSARDLAFDLELVRSPTGSTAETATPTGATGLSVLRRWRWLLAGAVAVLAIGAVTSILRRAGQPPVTSVGQLTFQLGTVSRARFTPEGRVVFSAAWNGQASEVFTQAPGNPEAQSLGLRDMVLLGVSVNGELAVLLRPSSLGVGTLAVVPGVGGSPREVAEDIREADWSPTGELAVIRNVGMKTQIEFPIGKSLLQTDYGFANLRVSPRGDALAVKSAKASGDGWNLIVVERDGKVRTLSEEIGYGYGLAWTPSGEEVWYSNLNAVWASSLSGVRSLVYQGVSTMWLEDISRDGRVLLNAQEPRVEVAFLSAEQRGERLLSWLDETSLCALADDGRRVLFASYPSGSPVTYIRPTDGSPPVKLGPGRPLDLAPDGNSVLIRPDERSSTALSVLPVGAGVPRTIAVNGLNVINARWLHDGKRIVVMASGADSNHGRLYIVPLENGSPVPIPGAAVDSSKFEVSRDDQRVAALSLDGILTLYSTNGSEPIPLPGLGKNTIPIGWSAEGHLWARDTATFNRTRLFKYDVDRRRVLEERSVAPADLSGVTWIGNVRITPDGRALAFNYGLRLTNLFVLDGVGRVGSRR